MKAFLLAAGIGSRLRPITDEIPKCLVPIKGKPLLGWWFDLLELHNIDEVLINLHYLPELVVDFVKTYDTKVKVHFYFEKELLGSAGTLRENKEFVKNEDAFFILYADNLTNVNLSRFYEDFKMRNSLFSMALFDSDKPEMCGIATLDRDNKIIDFIEKPKFPSSNLANAGMYLAMPKVLDLIPDGDVVDFGYEVLPKLKGMMYGYKLNEYILDIGTLENLKKAENSWKSLI